MTVTVNPPKQLRVPVKFREDRELRGYFDQVHQILFQLSQRTGGSTDTIEVATDGLREFDEIDGQAQRIADIEESLGDIDDLFQPKEEANYVSTAVDYTTISNDIVICSNTTEITVTLNSEPENFETVIVKRTDAKVVIDGSTRRIDADLTVVLDLIYTSLTLIYSVDSDSWSII